MVTLNLDPQIIFSTYLNKRHT